MKRILAIDYGREHVGLAMADTPLAEPLKTVPTSQVMPTIRSMISELGITDIVIGKSEGAMQAYIAGFADNIGAAFGLPLHWYDEALSSHETRVALAQAGVAKQKREQKIDHQVAAHILQGFLDDNPDFFLMIE